MIERGTISNQGGRNAEPREIVRAGPTSKDRVALALLVCALFVSVHTIDIFWNGNFKKSKKKNGEETITNIHSKNQSSCHSEKSKTICNTQT